MLVILFGFNFERYGYIEDSKREMHYIKVVLTIITIYYKVKG